MNIRITSLVSLVALCFVMSALHAQSNAQWSNTLSSSEKIYGLSKFWSEVNRNFAFMEQVGGEAALDSIYQVYIPQVVETKNDYEYYRKLEQFCALLKDGHTNIYYPEEWIDKLTSALTDYFLVLKEFDNEVYVVGINESKLQEVPLGSELVSINGMSVNDYIDKEIYPYLSVSTSFKKQEALNNLFKGPVGKQYEVCFCLPNGKPFQLLLTNGWFTKKENVRTPGLKYGLFEHRELGDGLHYILLNSFADPNITKEFLKILPELRKAKGIVVDLRYNGGGNSLYAEEIISYLTNAPELGGAKAYTTEYNAYYASIAPYLMENTALLKEDTLYAQIVEVAKKKFKEQLPFTTTTNKATEHIEVPVAVLCSSMTCSAAENFLICIDPLKNFFTVGEPSFGSTGNPIYGILPGGGTYRICTIESTYPDGRHFINIGVKPDIEIYPSLREYISDKDMVLERAVSELKKRIR